jgi:hypothetical protein
MITDRYGTAHTTGRFVSIFWASGRPLVNWVVRPESVECKCKCDVVGNIRQSPVFLPLHDHVSDVAVSSDGPPCRVPRFARLPI